MLTLIPSEQNTVNIINIIINTINIINAFRINKVVA